MGSGREIVDRPLDVVTGRDARWQRKWASLRRRPGVRRPRAIRTMKETVASPMLSPQAASRRAHGGFMATAVSPWLSGALVSSETDAAGAGHVVDDVRGEGVGGVLGQLGALGCAEDGIEVEVDGGERGDVVVDGGGVVGDIAA